jgi:hypothetical protein
VNVIHHHHHHHHHHHQPPQRRIDGYIVPVPAMPAVSSGSLQINRLQIGQRVVAIQGQMPLDDSEGLSYKLAWRRSTIPLRRRRGKSEGVTARFAAANLTTTLLLLYPSAAGSRSRAL